jgi:hypothetical protein
MFQLIVAVISIALVAALAIASIYYGGKAFNQGTLKANVTTLVNAGQQISGAQALYLTEKGSNAADVASLYSGAQYLAGAPSVSSIAASGWELLSNGTTNGAIAYVPFKADVNKTEVCRIVGEQAGTASTSPQFYCVAKTAPTVSAAAGAADGFAYKI